VGTHIKGNIKIMNLINLAKEFGISPRGVIHVGAHEGQEASDYEGLSQLYIEPIPSLAKLLKDKGLDVIEIAISNYTGTSDFYITDFDQGSSLLLPLEHSVQNKITVNVDTLENAVPDSSPYNCLVVDVQGAELDVLKGSKVENFDLIICETNSRERYFGSPVHQDIVNYLESQGFKLSRFFSHSDDNVIKDCVFVRV
jgi:FkbM family methyltransferase